MVLVDFAMVGHLGKLELGGAALATTWFNLINHPMVGAATALDTLFAQSFGAGQHERYGDWLRLGLLSLALLCMPCAAVLAVCEPFLLAIGQDPELAAMAGQYCLRLIPSLWPHYAFIVLTKYLQAQGILLPSVGVGILANASNAALNYVLIYSLGFGFLGAPVATTLMRWLQLGFILAYLWWARARHARTWPSSLLPRYQVVGVANKEGEDEESAIIRSSGALATGNPLDFSEGAAANPEPRAVYNRDTRHSPPRGEAEQKPVGNTSSSSEIGGVAQLRRDLHALRSLALPGACMLALEAWAFEVSSLLAGLLGDLVSLDAHIILLNVCGFTFLSFPFALGIAASIRVGHLLGAGKPNEAKRATAVVLVLTTAGSVTMAGCVYIAARQYIGRAFTSDEEVIRTIATLAPIAALFQVSDGVQSAVAGSLRGMGRQQLVAALNLVGFWVIGTSVGVVLTFGPPRLGVAGLWWGLALGISATSVVSVGMLSRTNWTREAAMACERVAGVEVGQGESPADASTLESRHSEENKEETL
jgi:MATE family multidrug resistance protein